MNEVWYKPSFLDDPWATLEGRPPGSISTYDRRRADERQPADTSIPAARQRRQRGQAAGAAGTERRGCSEPDGSTAVVRLSIIRCRVCSLLQSIARPSTSALLVTGHYPPCSETIAQPASPC